MSESSVMTPVRKPQFRVTVNSRCGRACFYCRPSGEAVGTPPGISLARNDLIAVAQAVRESGIDSIKLTGGDPALYEPLVDVVGQLKEIGFETVEVISRHPQIVEAVPGLRSNGLDILNISLDTLNPYLHRRITGVGDLPEIVSSVRRAVAAGLNVKINTVVMSGVNDSEIGDIIDFAAVEGVATLKLLDVIDDLDQGDETFAARLRGIASDLARLYTDFDRIVPALEESAHSVALLSQGDLGHPMLVYALESGLNVVVKDSTAGAWYGDVCNGCDYFPCHDALMALRLTADLRLQFCLLRSDNTIDLRPALATGDSEQLRSLVRTAIGEYSATWFTNTKTRRRLVVTSEEAA